MSFNRVYNRNSFAVFRLPQKELRLFDRFPVRHFDGPCPSENLAQPKKFRFIFGPFWHKKSVKNGLYTPFLTHFKLKLPLDFGILLVGSFMAHS